MVFLLGCKVGLAGVIERLVGYEIRFGVWSGFSIILVLGIL
jgi:hypothetical protein